MDKLADVEYTELKHETQKAYLFAINGKDVWIPKSLSEVDKDDKIVTVPEWFAIKEELV